MNKLNWEQLTAVAALVVALGALAFSVLESRRAETFTRLAAMPAVTFTYAKTADAGFTFSVLNRSDDHAKIKWLEFFVDGEMVDSYDAIFKEAEIGQRTGSFRMMWPEGHLAAEAELDLLEVPDPGVSEKLLNNLYRVSAQLCFCSIFGDCKIAYFNPQGLADAASCTPDDVYEQKLNYPPSFYQRAS